jgi:hypothetical protein
MASMDTAAAARPPASRRTPRHLAGATCSVRSPGLIDGSVTANVGTEARQKWCLFRFPSDAGRSHVRSLLSS